MDGRFDKRFALLALLLVTGLSNAAPPTTGLPVTVTVKENPESSEIEEWLTISVNGVTDGEPRLVRESAGLGFFIAEADVVSLALPPGAVTAIVEIDGQRRVRLAQRPGVSIQRDDANGSLLINIDPWLFAPQNLQGNQSAATRIDTGEAALFANYDLFATRGDYSMQAGQFELGTSRGRYSIISSALVTTQDSARLDTTLRADFPEHRATFGLGDMITSGVASERSVRFAGIQWATDFGTEPGFIPHAMPRANGVAVLPSAVDLYVNGAAVSHRDVSSGPFSIPDVAVPAGTGLIELRVRDALGREQVVTQPFLVSPLLLKPGLTAYSFELGSVREGYAVKSFGYGEAFSAFGLKRGITDEFTLQGGAEVLRDQATMRAAAVKRLGDRMVVQAGGAVSEASARFGYAATLAFEVTGRRIDFGMSWRESTANFTELASLDPQARLRRTLSGQLSMHLNSSASLSLIHAYREPVEGIRGYVTTASYSISQLFGGSINAYASRADFSSHDTTVGVMFTRSNGPRTMSSGFVRDNKGGIGVNLQAGRTATRESAWGWDMDARSGTDQMVAGRLQALSPWGSGNFQTGLYDGHAAVSAGWRGGWVWARGITALTPPIYGAIGVVDVPGAANVPIFHGGEDSGRTNKNGELIVTSLRPYQDNELSLDSSNMSVNAWIDSTEMVVRPYARNVVRVRFPVSAATSSFRLKLASDQTAVPSGASATSDGEEVPVGDDGLVAVPMSTRDSTIQVQWGENGCEARVTAEQWRLATENVIFIQCTSPGTPQ